MSKILLIFIGIVCAALASPVDSLTAKSAGRAFLFNAGANAARSSSAEQVSPSAELSLVYTATFSQASQRSAQEREDEEAKPLFYVFNANQTGGFVIVSGDDAAVPILAYSDENSFDAQNISPSLRYWLDGYKGQIEELRLQNASASDEIKRKWDDLLSGKSVRSAGAKGPLVSAKWDQSPFYNAFLPSDIPVGCVAVTMGQIMNYWKYPLRGTGSHSYTSANLGTLSANFGNTVYDWSLIPNSLAGGLNADSLNPTAEQNALAELLYHAGISVDMDYAPAGSGAFVFFKTGFRYDVAHSAETALETFFAYDKGSIGVERKNFDDASWINLMMQEIDNGRPVIYSGDPPPLPGGGSGGSGHAFVCDGYDLDGNLHFNWGWGGRGDGFFHISSLIVNTGGSGGPRNYSANQDALIRIAPPLNRQAFDIRLSAIRAAQNSVSRGDEIQIFADISNAGNNIFSGNFCVILSDDDGKNVDFIVIPETALLGKNSVSLDFTSAASAIPAGEYNVDVYWAISGGAWLKLDGLPQEERIKITVIDDGGSTSVRDIASEQNRAQTILAQTVVREKMEIMLPEGERVVTFVVYDALGNVVYNSERGSSTASTGSATSLTDGRGTAANRGAAAAWDLRNSAGRFVAAGAYLVIVEAKDRDGKMKRYSGRVGVKR